METKMKKIKVTFPKGITKVHVPFEADIGSHYQLYKQVERLNYPKNTRRIEACIVLAIDLEEGQTSYVMSEVVLMK